MNLRRWTLAALAALLAACAAPSGTEAPPHTEPTVLTLPAAPPVNPALRAFGEVHALRKHVVGAETTGRIQRIHVDVGDRVEPGQLLMEFDGGVARRRVAAAEREATRASAQLAERERHRARSTELEALGAASSAEAEQAQLELAAAAAAVALADAELTAARRELAAHRLHAPESGWVAVRHVEPSTVVGSGQPLLELDADGPPEIRASAPGHALLGLVPGTDVSWRTSTANGRAVIERIAGRASGAGAREVVLRVTQGEPAIGALATVDFDAEIRRATAWIPTPALLTGRNGVHSVRRIAADQRVEEVAVEPIRLANGGVLVAGIAPGDAIVVAGAEYVEAGTRVRVRQATR